MRRPWCVWFDVLVAENFFHLPDFALGCASDLFANAFVFHVTILGRASGDFLRFTFGLAAGALCSISQTALHNFLLLHRR
jgi:hypothetical protein